MRSALRPVGVLLAGTLLLCACGQKGPLCLQDPKPATVPVLSAAPDGSAPQATESSAPASVPVHPIVPGYQRCR